MRPLVLPRRLLLVPLALVPLAAILLGCESAYYSAMEQLGIEKREILVDRVEDGRDAQKEAKKEIVDALEAFKAVTGFEGGELEDAYGRLKDKYESSADAVGEVQERIAKIEDVASDLFKEWSGEIRDMEDPALKKSSQEMLDDTRVRYGRLVKAMKAAESKMEPVLRKLKDHVVFLKHNLNARAVASLQKNLVTIEDDVSKLVFDMEKSIAEADAFIESMQG
jgi:hypothetical protein